MLFKGFLDLHGTEVQQPMATRTYTSPQTVAPISYPPSFPTVHAAPRVVKEVVDKDRRSRAAYTTYHQAPKMLGMTSFPCFHIVFTTVFICFLTCFHRFP